MTAQLTLDKDSLRSLLTAGRDTTWSWQEADVPVVAERLGWHDVHLMPGLGAMVNPGHGLGSKAVRFTFHQERVRRITMRITSKAGKDDAAGQAFLADAYAEALAVATEVLGAPSVRTTGANPEVRWRGPETTLILEKLVMSVTLTWATNTFQDEWDEVQQG